MLRIRRLGSMRALRPQRWVCIVSICQGVVMVAERVSVNTLVSSRYSGYSSSDPPLYPSCRQHRLVGYCTV